MTMKEYEKITTLTEKTGISVGLAKGHITKRLDGRAKTVKPWKRTPKSRIFARELIGEIAGFTPYEKKLLDLINTGLDKRARKFAKKRLGTMRRAKKKIEKLSNIAFEMKQTK